MRRRATLLAVLLITVISLVMATAGGTNSGRRSRAAARGHGADARGQRASTQTCSRGLTPVCCPDRS